MPSKGDEASRRQAAREYAKKVKAMRDATGFGMADCKRMLLAGEMAEALTMATSLDELKPVLAFCLGQHGLNALNDVKEKMACLGKDIFGNPLLAQPSQNENK